MNEEIVIEFVEDEITVEFVDEVVEIHFDCTVPGIGVPAGGDVGDVLTKIGVGDYDTDWLPPGSAANFETYPAGENLSSGRVVIIDGGDAFYFQPATLAHYGRVFGITKTSATIGNDVTIQRDGAITDAAFSGFADEVLYVGADGELQTTWDAGGMVQKAGVAAGSNKVKIDFSIQIKLL